MRELRLVAVNEDGSRLLLRADAQEPEFTVRIDERLHAALRGDRARLGQLEIQLDSQLRPRDIQARVRAGESVAQVATAAGLSAERVMRYAGPVLAEREHIADRARRCAVRRPGADGPAPLLEDAVTSHLNTKGVDLETLDWDAWRRDDGRWLVVTSWQVGGKPRAARWSFDPSGRSVSASDDEARWLSGERPPEEPAPAPVAARLAVVPTISPAAEGSSDVPDTTTPADQTPADQPEAGGGAAMAGTTVRTGAGPEEASTGARAGRSRGPDAEPGTREPAPRAVPAAVAHHSPALLDEPPTAATDPGRLRLSEIALHVEDEAATEVTQPVPQARKARASVPTWDEIMFGRRRRQD